LVVERELPIVRRIYDANELARDMRKTFTAREVEKSEVVDIGPWPPKALQHVGESLAVAYASDKWKERDASGRRDIELYKHIAESRNQAYVKPGIFVDYFNPGTAVDMIGPRVSFADVPMPQHFAILGGFEEIDLRLHVAGTNERPRFGRGDEGVVQVSISGARLGASKFLWSEEAGDDQPFLFVFTKADGVLILITGDELDVERDGIVG
jgi:hypothetical protein